MAYEYQITSQISQFGTTEVNVLLTDPDGRYPDYRTTLSIQGQGQSNSSFSDAISGIIVAQTEAAELALVPPIVPIDMMMAFAEFCYEQNPALLAAEFVPFIQFINDRHNGLLAGDFPQIAEYMNNKYPGLIDAFKVAKGIS